MTIRSVAMTDAVADQLCAHLLRRDRQEDICLATYSTSTGAHRTTYILDEVYLPRGGERLVHGNATITGKYVLRLAGIAMRRGRGLAILHSHPGGAGWQSLSGPDKSAESGYAELVQRVTGRPLLGLTLAGDRTWSARTWSDSEPEWVSSVRTLGTALHVDWNDTLVPSRVDRELQDRTISAWGDQKHADITRLRILVVGVGSVGLDVVQRLAATGVREIGVMDTDQVERLNLDRMVGATRRDARLRRPKVDLAARLARRASTAPTFKVVRHQQSVCTAPGLAAALDYDMIFCCVDRPLPRSVLNSIAYADLVPVIDGGIGIDTFTTGLMRGATRRVQTATPGRPCLTCSGQLSPADVALDASGDLDDPEYIQRAGGTPQTCSPNVAALAAGVSSGQLDQFVSLVARPGGLGVPGPLRFILASHTLEHTGAETAAFCPTEADVAVGDDRDVVTVDEPSEPARSRGTPRAHSWVTRLLDYLIEHTEGR